MRGVFVLFLFGFVMFGVPVGAVAQIAMPKPLYILSETFVEDDFKWSKRQGTGVIAGLGSLRAQGGFLKSAVGEEVTLVAKTPYTDEIVAATRTEDFFESYLNVQKDPNYNQYRLSQTADKDGRFRFENLPAGEWYIVTRVVWYTRDETSQVHLHGGLLWGQISIVEGEVRDDVQLNSTKSLAK